MSSAMQWIRLKLASAGSGTKEASSTEIEELANELEELELGVYRPALSIMADQFGLSDF